MFTKSPQTSAFESESTTKPRLQGKNLSRKYTEIFPNIIEIYLSFDTLFKISFNMWFVVPNYNIQL